MNEGKIIGNDLSANLLNLPKKIVVRHRGKREFFSFLTLTVLHLPLGILFYNFPFTGLIHSFGTLAFGLYFAFQKDRKNLYRAAYLTAYLVGTEILWRMSEAPVYWEFGKYAVALIMIAALVRRHLSKIPFLPLIYFLLLVPACFLTLSNNDWELARAKLSSNMSGPLTLFIGCCFFSHLKFNWLQMRRLFLWLLIPVLTVGFTTFFFTASTPELTFGTESNYATSGGYGPNQVSSVLGLGAFAAVFCFAAMNNAVKFNFYFAASIVFLAAQCFLTFSRGGMYNAVGATAFVLAVSLFNRKVRRRIIPLAAVVALFGIFVMPYLNDFTGGKLLERYEDIDSSNRVKIIETDFDIWEQNLIFGIGAGEAKFYRRENLAFSAASHTEFTRLVSEHGLFGILALAILLIMTIFNFIEKKSNFERALIAGFVVWSSLYMLNAGMRLAAPGFLIGLSFISVRSVRPLSVEAKNKMRYEKGI